MLINEEQQNNQRFRIFSPIGQRIISICFPSHIFSAYPVAAVSLSREQFVHNNPWRKPPPRQAEWEIKRGVGKQDIGTDSCKDFGKQVTEITVRKYKGKLNNFGNGKYVQPNLEFQILIQ